MRVKIDVSALRQIRWHDYAVRFIFGGLITAVAGIIAKKFGPGVGGLFLAFVWLTVSVLIWEIRKAA